MSKKRKQDNSIEKSNYYSTYKKVRKIKNIIGLIFVVFSLLAVAGLIYVLTQMDFSAIFR